MHTIYAPRRQLILCSLGLSENDKRIPVRRVDDKIFEDCVGQMWNLTYVEGGVLLQERTSGEQRRSEHLSDIVVFYSEHEFTLYLQKIEGKLC